MLYGWGNVVTKESAAWRLSGWIFRIFFAASSHTMSRPKQYLIPPLLTPKSHQIRVWPVSGPYLVRHRSKASVSAACRSTVHQFSQIQHRANRKSDNTMCNCGRNSSVSPLRLSDSAALKTQPVDADGWGNMQQNCSVAVLQRSGVGQKDVLLQTAAPETTKIISLLLVFT